ncbi:MAG: MoaD family protein [Deltaproteobacteria bacterium]|nr:MoaD family protein [Deltaproteobacteria bacterium]
MISIKVRLFAALKEIIGKNQLDLQIPEGSTVKDVIAVIEETYPAVKKIIKISKYAVNMEYTETEKKLTEGDEITIIMPVSGGVYSASETNMHIEITGEKIDDAKVLDFVSDISAGSVLLFNGTVRDNDDGKPVEYLYYEAYEEMAVKEIKKLISAAFNKYNILKVCVIHRTGKMDAGEISISIGVSSPHREDSYIASKFLIDNIKETVPVWKKEMFEEGGRWKRL